MDIALNEDQRAIQDGVAKVARRFDDAYWTECDSAPRFPHEFHRAMAEAGWLGITMPEELGGAGLGVTEAAIMMHAVTESGGGMAAASALHVNLFGPHAVVVHGTEEQKERWLKPLIAGAEKVGPHKTSMLQDVEAGRAIELDAIVGAVHEIARGLAMPTPSIDALLGLTRLMGHGRGLYRADIPRAA